MGESPAKRIERGVILRGQSKRNWRNDLFKNQGRNLSYPKRRGESNSNNSGNDANLTGEPGEKKLNSHTRTGSGSFSGIEGRGSQ